MKIIATLKGAVKKYVGQWNTQYFNKIISLKICRNGGFGDRA